jgi:hypothetical protein
MARCRCRVMLVMSLLRRLGRGAMYLPSHVVQPKSGSMTRAVMCYLCWDVATLQACIMGNK